MSRARSWSWSPAARSCCASSPSRCPAERPTSRVDLTDADAPARIRAHLEAEHGGRLDLLVNNAGAAWRGNFAEAGYANVQPPHGAQLRRRRPPHRGAAAAAAGERPERDRQRRQHRRPRLPRPHRRLLGQQVRPDRLDRLALCGGAAARRSRRHGPARLRRHRGLPGDRVAQKALTRWVVSKPEKVAEAIYEAGPGGKAERYVPRPYALAAVVRILAPRLVRRVLSGGAATSLTTSTAAENGSDSAADSKPTSQTWIGLGQPLRCPGVQPGVVRTRRGAGR